ncbi:MAG: hypothetical protein R6U51_01910 [Anaerolineales bacterium]
MLWQCAFLHRLEAGGFQARKEFYEIFVGIDKELRKVGPEIAGRIYEEIQEAAVTLLQAEERTGEALYRETPRGTGGDWERAGLQPQAMTRIRVYRKDRVVSVNSRLADTIVDWQFSWYGVNNRASLQQIRGL